MNPKDLYFKALARFRERNHEVLPQLQLQYGANERWFQREFTLAMNCHLAGSWNPTSLRRFADCEFKHGDITIWDGGSDDALALYEVKAIYSDMSADTIRSYVATTAKQLVAEKAVQTDRKLGLFFSIYYAQGVADDCGRDPTDFEKVVRDAVREHFTSDHNIRMTELSPLTEIDFGGSERREPWRTQSWITWGILRT